MFSMMSISPQPGQPTGAILSPSIQNAGHSPCPRGIWIRASIRPNCHAPSPWVLRRAEVYALFPNGSRRASITRMPLATRAVSTRLVSNSRSPLPQPLPPVSRTHFVVSSAVPSNSSYHTSRHGPGVWGGAVVPPAGACWSARHASTGHNATRASASTRRAPASGSAARAINASLRSVAPRPPTSQPTIPGRGAVSEQDQSASPSRFDLLLVQVLEARCAAQNLVIQPAIDDAPPKAPLFPQLHRRNLSFLRPLVNGLRREPQVRRNLFNS